MESKKFEMIMQLMDELKDEMQYGEDDLSSRLGREKPKVEIEMMSGGSPLDEEEMGPVDDDMGDEFDESPDQKFKNRLMKLRGA